MNDYKVGAHILESLTQGMYREPKTIYREYIQNACDSIDKAIDSDILQPDDARVEIWIDEDAHSITVEDNGTGIRAADFMRVLGNIADSDKRVNRTRDFVVSGDCVDLLTVER